MAQIAAEEGYGRATVTRVCSAAGLSRVTFYEHFPNGEECFVECCRNAVARFYEKVRSGAGGHGAETAVWSLLEAILCEVESDPQTARLILLESRGGPPATRLEYVKLVASLRSLLQPLCGAQGRQSRYLASPGALLGGILGVAAVRVLLGGTHEIGGRRKHLARWVDSYRVEAQEPPLRECNWVQLGRRYGIGRSARVPREPGLSAGAMSRRGRLIEATAQVTALSGYAGLRVADVVAAAGVQRQAFYAEFRNKADAFQAVQVKKLRQSMAAAAAEFALGSTWPDRVWRGLAGLLDYLAEHPYEAELALLEVYAAGEEETRIAQDSRAAFMLFLEEGYRQPVAARVSNIASEAVGAAIYALICEMLLQGQARRLPELLPESAFIALAPFIGPRRALEFVELKVAGAGREARTTRPGSRGPRDRPGNRLVADPI